MQRASRFALLALELAFLSTLICATRCANWRDVFFDGGVYFTDADCYARMSRARICDEHPGTIVRHHDFENFPTGTTPHTTAPFDYAIVVLAACLRPFTTNALELGGAFVSPLIALIGGWLLWWWMRRMRFQSRWVGLILYATSAIIVHGTELGRPDHQSLAVVLVLVATCAEWSLRNEPSRGWSATAGAAWALAIWVSAYEPLAAFLVAAACAPRSRHVVTRWIVFAAIIVVALIVERRAFALPDIWSDARTANWLATIGEMQRAPIFSSVWLGWFGLFVIAAPVLLAVGWSRRTNPPLVVILLAATCFAATLMQVRWGYFFAAVLALLLPAVLEIVRTKPLAIGIAIVSFAPLVYSLLRPNESLRSTRAERTLEMRDVRAAAQAMITSQSSCFIAPWWLSPAIAYWSGNNGVAGSSHESIDGITDTARFYLAADDETARQILDRHHVEWVIGYDADRIAQNSGAVLGVRVPPNSLSMTLSRTPTHAPASLKPVYQNGTCTLFSFQNSP